jgi:hypothetical protein
MNPVHIANPVEFSFLQWLGGLPDSGHPQDMRSFYRFVKTVCRYRAKNWKDSERVRSEILKVLPSFNRASLDHLMSLYPYLVECCDTPPYVSDMYLDLPVADGHYLEITARKGKVTRKEVPLHLGIVPKPSVE